MYLVSSCEAHVSEVRLGINMDKREVMKFRRGGHLVAIDTLHIGKTVWQLGMILPKNGRDFAENMDGER